MAKVSELKENLSRTAADLRTAVDLSIELRAQSTENRAEVIKLWEEFLGQLFGYIKQRSKETRDNLLAGISWTRMKLF